MRTNQKIFAFKIKTGKKKICNFWKVKIVQVLQEETFWITEEVSLAHENIYFFPLYFCRVLFYK